MEFCDCGSVRDIMVACDSLLDELQIATIMKYAALGLKFLHDNHKLHRDIKAGNILVNSRGQCKLGLFLVSFPFVYYFIFSFPQLTLVFLLIPLLSVSLLLELFVFPFK